MEPVTYTNTGFLLSFNLLNIFLFPSMFITRLRLYARNDNAISVLTEIFLLVKK